MGLPPLLRVGPMALSFYLREQAERCRRLARGSTVPNLCESLLKLADEFAARADAVANHDSNDGSSVWRSGHQDQGGT
jgi:hypothetical protein